MSKIIDKLNAQIEKREQFYSFEYFPPKSDALIQKLKGKLREMANHSPAPVFMDVTWAAGGGSSEATLEISTFIQKELTDINMHLTCTNMPIEKFKDALEAAKKAGIRNICALRGDPPRGQEKWEAIEGGFSYAVDLVRYIRKTYGDYFCIAVAGYPEGHTECTSLEEDIQHLKAKIEAGADFVITQLFYDVDIFLDWLKKIRAAGITCPVLPGMMPIRSYGGFNRMITLCKTKVPEAISAHLETIKHDDILVRKYGVDLVVEMSQKILKSGELGLHFYTLNEEDSSREALERLGLIKSKAQLEKEKERQIVYKKTRKYAVYGAALAAAAIVLKNFFGRRVLKL